MRSTEHDRMAVRCGVTVHSHDYSRVSYIVESIIDISCGSAFLCEIVETTRCEEVFSYRRRIEERGGGGRKGRKDEGADRC